MDVSPTVPNLLIAAAKKQVTALSMQHQDSQALLYDDQLAFFLENLVLQFGNSEQADPNTIQTAQLAALFYPLGYRLDRKNPVAAAQASCLDFLQKQGKENLYPSIEHCLLANYQQSPDDLASNLLADALISIYCNDEVHHWADLRALDQELRSGQGQQLEQAELKLQELITLRYHTRAGKIHWQKLIGQQILTEKKRLEKMRRTQVLEPATAQEAPFSQLETSLPVRGTQTYFRVVYRNHINLSAIADNKANIMISVNSILISVLITFLSYRNIAETQPMILLPVIIFLVTGLASLIFAVLSARPKVTQLPATAEQPTPGLAFFGNFVKLPLSDFSRAMDRTLQSSNLLYSSMVEDLYHLGKVLDKKYRYLSISYNIFMVGLIITVVLFLFTLLVS
jgi:hypothetical protein